MPAERAVRQRGLLHLERLEVGNEIVDPSPWERVLARFERDGGLDYAGLAASRSDLDSYLEALAGCDHLICYAVKANSNLAVLDTLARLGAGFDIVSGGELERVLAAGGDPARVVFSGVGKTREEMARALEVGIYCFNIESAAELEQLQQVAAQMDRVAPVSVRVNPDVDAGTPDRHAAVLDEARQLDRRRCPLERGLDHRLREQQSPVVAA